MEMALQLYLLLLCLLLQPNIISTIAQSHDLDFTYMKSVKNGTDMPLKDEYDYIVIGGGTAGCPLAATLSSTHKVLVVERGGPPSDTPNVLNVAGFATVLMEEDDGTTPAQLFTSEDGVVNARGRVLGGTSMLNAGFYSRGDNHFLNVSEIEWDIDVMEESYKWVEETVAKTSDDLPFQAVIKEALLESGVVPDNGFTLDHVVGTKKSASSFDALGKRHGAVQLLNKANLGNLHVAVRAYVDRIIFDSSEESGVSAKGVYYTDSNGNIHEATIRDKGEVILSAGALGSPQLLLLSGIGPQPYLSSLCIPLVLDHPDVGNFVYDNPRNGIAFTPPSSLAGSYLQYVGIMEHQFIECISVPSPFSFPSPFGLFPANSPAFSLDTALITAKISGPLSTGTFELASSTDVRVTPKVRYNYFSDPIDLARCVIGMRKIGEMLRSPAMDGYKFVDSSGGREFKFLGASLPANQSDAAAMESFCRDTVATIWHYHGGCVAGKVVDSRLRVKGVGGLRVVDGSVFTVSPGTNPQATVMMLGRYMGLQILKQRISLIETIACDWI